MDKKKTTVLLLRIILGFFFLSIGFDKLLNNFSASEYLLNVSHGPFSEIFKQMANNKFVDFLVIFGEISIGIALSLGFLTKFASYMSILMMLMFYLSSPAEINTPINQNIIYVICFIILIVFDAGKYYGIDSQLEKTKLGRIF